MKIIRINANPVKPRNEDYPTGQGRNVAGAFRELDRRYRRIKRGVNELIDSIDFRIVEVNQAVGYYTNERIYVYELDMDEFARVNIFLQRLLNEELLGNPEGVFTEQWWLNINLEKSYESGTRVTLQSAKNVTTVKDAGPELSREVRSITIEDIIFQPGYQRRVGMVKARTFNGMKGLTDQSRSDLADTLARGMAAGKGVKQLKQEVFDRLDVSESRAERIVRTEINQAYRAATRDETDAFNEDIYDGSGFRLDLLWFSALSSTTRPNHASRHGKVYTTQEVADFYSRDANPINCLCSSTPTLVTDAGESFQSELSKTMREDREEFQSNA